ncbi:lipid-binding SYLF domain-containing protein [bacterium]|nr:lipid-binding SYLF domain-containing protein [bacterium]
MSVKTTLRRIFLMTLVLTLMGLNSRQLFADSAKEIDDKSTAALQQLYSTNAEIKKLGGKAKGILIFPEVKKAGLVIGGQGGEGVLRKAGRSAGYYKTAAGSIGLQAGVQEFSLAMFFMDDESVKYLETSDGWEIGSGPSVVMGDEGFGKTMTSSTVKKGIMAFIFGQKGLMAGIGIQGSKISKITPDK